VTPIKAKTGMEYVIFEGISESGETIKQITSKADADLFGVPPQAVLNAKTLELMFKDSPVVDMQFNQRGRLEDIVVG